MITTGSDGTISQGEIADLAVVDGDPLARSSNIRRNVMTLRAGTMYRSKELYETVGVSP